MLQCIRALGAPHQLFQIFKFILSSENAHHVDQFLLWNHFCISYSLNDLLRFCIRCSSFQDKLQRMCCPNLIPILTTKKNHSNPSSSPEVQRVQKTNQHFKTFHTNYQPPFYTLGADFRKIRSQIMSTSYNGPIC